MKVHSGAFSGAGMPDIYVVAPRPCPSCGEPVPGIAHHLETKTPGKKPAPIQAAALARLRAAGAVAEVVTSVEEAESIFSNKQIDSSFNEKTDDPFKIKQLSEAVCIVISDLMGAAASDGRRVSVKISKSTRRVAADTSLGHHCDTVQNTGGGSVSIIIDHKTTESLDEVMAQSRQAKLRD